MTPTYGGDRARDYIANLESNLEHWQKVAHERAQERNAARKEVQELKEQGTTPVVSRLERALAARTRELRQKTKLLNDVEKNLNDEIDRLRNANSEIREHSMRMEGEREEHYRKARDLERLNKSLDESLAVALRAYNEISTRYNESRTSQGVTGTSQGDFGVAHASNDVTDESGTSQAIAYDPVEHDRDEQQHDLDVAAMVQDLHWKLHEKEG